MQIKLNTKLTTKIIQIANVGDVFYLEKEDKYITSYASMYKRKIKTERIIAVSGSKHQPTAIYITKVTILK